MALILLSTSSTVTVCNLWVRKFTIKSLNNYFLFLGFIYYTYLPTFKEKQAVKIDSLI